MFRIVRLILGRILRSLRGQRITANRIRFGHAFPNPRGSVPSNPVMELCDLLAGGAGIGPRQPSNSNAVSLSETILGISLRRPVYAYVGCLHPALGRIGLIIDHGWYYEDPHGMTKCDSGGLASCIGGFSCLSADVAARALVDLTLAARTPWEGEIDDEISAAYPDWDAYLDGTQPRSDRLDKVRRECMEKAISAGADIDRRLWTWEVRAFSHIRRSHLAAVALTSEAYKELDHILRERSQTVDVQLLRGNVSPLGVEHFHERQVLDAFKVNG